MDEESEHDDLEKIDFMHESRKPKQINVSLLSADILSLISPQPPENETCAEDLDNEEIDDSNSQCLTIDSLDSVKSGESVFKANIQITIIQSGIIFA